MKRTLIAALPIALPNEIERLFEGAKIYDSSCSPEARVYYIEKDGGYFLKTAPRGTLKKESEMGAYFHKKGLSPEVLFYESGERDLLLTARAEGEDGTHFVSEPKRLCDAMAEALRALHETDAADCPVQNRMGEYLALADKNYGEGKFDLSLFGDQYIFRSAEDAYRVLSEGRSLLKNEVLLHGDYCLPNIMLDGYKVCAFIDVGNGGVGDRHVDLFWGAWTLWFNLGTDVYRDRFFDAYGRDLVDKDVLQIVSAAEIFG